MSAVNGTGTEDAAVPQLRRHMDRLRGRLFQQIEAFGVSEKQERAAKGVVRSCTYEAQADIEAALKGGEGPW